jgi:hypothetical protein
MAPRTQYARSGELVWEEPSGAELKGVAEWQLYEVVGA